MLTEYERCDKIYLFDARVCKRQRGLMRHLIRILVR
nr:MAG TPA: hypothetical protein [Caudoviricetes sp.]